MDNDVNNQDPALPKKKIILWIEDDVMIKTILGNKLIAAGFDVIHVSTGEEAIYRFKQVVPNLIVLDLLLPGIDGFELLKQIHNDETLKNIPVIILSNVQRESDIATAKSFGVKKFLIKPSTSLEEIITEVKTYCK